MQRWPGADSQEAMSRGYTGPPCPAPFNLAAHVLSAGAKTPEKIALDWIGRARWTYGALIGDVLGTAAGLSRVTRPGDMILLRLGNTPDFPIAYLAALAAGRVPIPTSAALTASEVRAMVQDLPIALTLRDESVACPDDLPQMPLDDLQALRSAPPAGFDYGDPDRLGYVVFTSGTSGVARAVAHAHRAIWARQMMMDGWYGLTSGDRVLHAGAFNWTYTLGTGLMDPWTRGATALIPPPGTASADLPALLADTGATIFAAAPGVYRQALRARIPALPALRHGLSAGEKLPEATRGAWTAATGTPIYEAYGMSECSTFISGSPARPAAPGTLGAPQPGRCVAILGPDGPLPAGQQGVIGIHRSDPGLMLGYLNAPEETAQRMQGDWFVTGDTATQDAAGFIRFDARSDDMMNAGGYRVSPLEVEAALSGAPGLTGVACAEVPVASGATVIAAFYTAAAALDTDALRTYAEGKLARYKQPRIYTHVPELPTGANGKILRRALREEWKATP